MCTHITYNSQTAVINLPHYKYVDKVLRSSSYEELMWICMNPDSPTKEISESYGAFSNLKRFTRINDNNWLHIGDGSMARTAAIFTMFSKSENYSIDPNIAIPGKLETWINKHNIKRLYPVKSKYEEADLQLDNYNIVCVHAHVDLEEVDSKFPNWTYLYSNPCCYPQKQSFSDEYMKEHNIVLLLDKIDLGILSERRRVLIYKKYHD